jgi:hypothetical protein
VRVAYDISAVRARASPRLVLDVFNIGNQRRALDLDQLHYVNPARTEVNPNYLKVNRYQPPLSARLGMLIGF